MSIYIPCPYQRLDFADVPGYAFGGGCPKCKGDRYHVPLKVEQETAKSANLTIAGVRINDANGYSIDYSQSSRLCPCGRPAQNGHAHGCAKSRGHMTQIGSKRSYSCPNVMAKGNIVWCSCKLFLCLYHKGKGIHRKHGSRTWPFTP